MEGSKLGWPVHPQERFPGPTPLPVLGNAMDFRGADFFTILERMVQEYGPVFELWFGGKRLVMVNNRDVVDELCDENRFVKSVSSSLEQLRLGAGDGLFTAHTDEENWGMAHRILMPVFGPLKIREMFPQMYEISQQMCLKWLRFGSSTSIDVAADFTRLTLDTIALCSMGYRFNSFYRDDSFHPFVVSMVGFLTEADQRATYPACVNRLFRRRAYRRWVKHIEVLRHTSRNIISERRKSGAKHNDLLTAMLEGKDPKSGRQLDDANIISNLITFLVAGHETTSGLLSFTLYYLMKNPKYLQEARAEVDSTIGSAKISISHLSHLPFIDAVLRETLRLMPTAPGFAVTPKKDEIIAGRYRVMAGESINVMLHTMHRDKSVWGPDAEEFKPERMYGEKFEKLPRNAWKPFGNGARACIGRAFAWQETQLALAMILQTFDLHFEDPTYELKIKETLTIKPEGFRIKASPREDITIKDVLSLNVQASPVQSDNPNDSRDVRRIARKKPIQILYGSNQGTCETLAHRLAFDVQVEGFDPGPVIPLNDAVNNLPTDRPVVIIVSSYDGQPTDNATEFLRWLETCYVQKKTLGRVSYTVFGCGHRDWIETYQRVPMRIDNLIFQLQGNRLAPRGEADATMGDMISSFEAWENEHLWPALDISSGKSKGGIKGIERPQIHINLPLRVSMRRNMVEAVVLSSRTLSSDGEKRHIELNLPPGQKYRPGDHIAVFPSNAQINVRRALTYFHLATDASVTVETPGAIGLPSSTPIPASDLLGEYLELGTRAGPRDIQILAENTSDDRTKNELKKLSDALYGTVRKHQISVLDLLEQYPAVHLPLGIFLALLPPIRLRTYSISSSPLRDSGRAALAWSVIRGEARAGMKPFLGLASNYLASLKTGDIIYVEVRSAKSAFHLPKSSDTTPVIMIAAGSGIAPFYGFMEERSMLQAQGTRLAPGLLFFGCRAPASDDLFRGEIDEMERKNVVTVYRAFSRAADHRDAAGCRYVQERLRHERALVAQLWRGGAQVYVCGSKAMAESVKLALYQVLQESGDFHDGENGDSCLPEGRVVVESFTNTGLA